MKKYFLYTLVIINFGSVNIQANQGVMAKIYGYIFGNKDVSVEYRVQARQALASMGINGNNVAIKQMNSVGPKCARLDLSSFTAFGIWLNEKYFDAMNNDEKEFKLYHEAAHYAQKHHQKILLGSAAMLPLVGIAFKKCNDYLVSKAISAPSRYGTLTGSAFILLATLYFYVLPKIVKQQEKEADLFAADALMKSNNTDVLDGYLESLKKISNAHESTIWWYSIKEQINYLEAIKKEYQQQG